MKEVLKPKKRVLILGAGFAGMYAYIELAKSQNKSFDLDITIINRNDEFLFIPLIHEVATGNLTPSSVVQPIRSVARECRFLEGEVVNIDADKQTVKVRNHQLHKNKKNVSEEPEMLMPYDYLILALGAHTTFRDVPGAKENSFTLYDLDDAKSIKNQIIESFEKAQFLDNEEDIKRVLRFVVVGGGPTGTELAAEIAEFIDTSIKKTFKDLSKKAKVTLISGSERILGPMDEWFAHKAQRVLRSYGVEIILNTKVKEVSERRVLAGNEEIATENVFWAAGVKATQIPIKSSKKIERDVPTGRLKVNSFMQVHNYSNIFAIGDQAYILDKENGQPYPMRAQFATREGKKAAQNIVKHIKNEPLGEFHYRDMGFIISLGKGNALAKIFAFNISGPLAWFIYRTAYLSKVVGIKAKIRTVVEWTLNIFFQRDVSKL